MLLLRNYESGYAPGNPWAIRVDFSNGVSTKDFKRRTPVDEQPLIKFGVVEAAIPFGEISGGRMLDVGCNAGYNCIQAAKKYGLSCTGIDVVPRHIEISRFLSETAGINAEFLIASVETFSRPEKFDVAFHFGTLYHLSNPVLSLRATFDNLRLGVISPWKPKCMIIQRTRISATSCICKIMVRPTFER